jgi:geranylgeranyl diphosphate synthase type II
VQTALLGLQASRDEAHRLTNEAMQALAVFGGKADALRQLAEHLLNRDY